MWLKWSFCVCHLPKEWGCPSLTACQRWFSISGGMWSLSVLPLRETENRLLPSQAHIMSWGPPFLTEQLLLVLFLSHVYPRKITSEQEKSKEFRLIIALLERQMWDAWDDGGSIGKKNGSFPFSKKCSPSQTTVYTANLIKSSKFWK